MICQTIWEMTMEGIKTFFLHQAEAPNQLYAEVWGNWAFTPICWLYGYSRLYTFDNQGEIKGCRLIETDWIKTAVGAALFAPGLAFGTVCTLYARYEDPQVAIRSEKITAAIYLYDRKSEELWGLGVELLGEIMTRDESQLKAQWEKKSIDPLIRKLADLIPSLTKHMLEELEFESQATKNPKETLISTQVTEKNTAGRYCWVFFQVVQIYQIIRQQKTIHIDPQENFTQYHTEGDAKSASEPFYQKDTTKYALREAYNTFCKTFANLAATIKDTRFKKHTFLDESKDSYVAYLSNPDYGGEFPTPIHIGRLFLTKKALDEVLANQK